MYKVFRDKVDPNKNHVKVLNDGTVIRGGYEAAYPQHADGLKWAKQCAKRVKGHIYIKDSSNKWVVVWSSKQRKQRRAA